MPPTVLREDNLEGARRSGDDPLEELGVSPQDFAEIALSGPLDWNGEQLDQLSDLMLGGILEPDILRELVQDFLTHTPQAREELRKRPTVPEVDRSMLDPEELAELDAPSVVMPYEPLSAPSVAGVNIDLDDWLKNK